MQETNIPNVDENTRVFSNIIGISFEKYLEANPDKTIDEEAISKQEKTLIQSFQNMNDNKSYFRNLIQCFEIDDRDVQKILLFDDPECYDVTTKRMNLNYNKGILELMITLTVHMDHVAIVDSDMKAEL